MPSKLQTLDDQHFEDKIAANDGRISIVIITLPWSGGSQLLRNIVAQYAENSSEGNGTSLHFYEMNADSSPRTRSRYRIGFIPTTLIFRGNQLIHQIKGVVSKHTFRQLLQPMLTGPAVDPAPSTRGQQP